MTDAPPTLPNLDALVNDAREVVTYWTAKRDEAQTQLDNAAAILDRLAGKSPQTTKALVNRGISDEVYRCVLSKLSDHGYAGLRTLQGAGVSSSTASVAMHHAGRRGHAVREQRGRKLRFQITEAGVEFLTRPDGPMNGQPPRREES